MARESEEVHRPVSEWDARSEGDSTGESRMADDFQMLVNSALPTLVREAARSESGKLYRSVLARIERPLLRQALDLAGGNQLKAARLLGINRNTLRKRLRLLGLLKPGSGSEI